MEFSSVREEIQTALNFARQGKLTAASPSFVAQRAEAATRLYQGGTPR